MARLEVKNLGISFGGLKAVDQVNFTVEPNCIMGLIGPNGAGKTTVFNLLTSVYRPSTGSIELDGKSLLGSKPHQTVANGLARTFQNIRLFKNMTVADNIKVSFQRIGRYSIPSGIFRLPVYWREEAKFEEQTHALLKVFNMEQTADLIAGNLPYGQQRKLEICRALATQPKILLLDEPAAGMNPTETEELMETIKYIREHFKISVLLIEHDMRLVMGLCERIVVLDYGVIIASGTPAEIRRNPKVIGAYLGSEGNPHDAVR